MTGPAPKCPRCAAGGVAVDRITLKALLTPDGLRRGIPAQPRYCGTGDCPIVYFDVDGEVTFAESELIVPVYAKHPGDPSVPVCYCFGVTAGSVCDTERVRSAREMVAREVQDGRCACEVKNPKGACCLGDLVRLERATAVTASPSPVVCCD